MSWKTQFWFWPLQTTCRKSNSPSVPVKRSCQVGNCAWDGGVVGYTGKSWYVGRESSVPVLGFCSTNVSIWVSQPLQAKETVISSEDGGLGQVHHPLEVPVSKKWWARPTSQRLSLGEGGPANFTSMGMAGTAASRGAGTPRHLVLPRPFLCKPISKKRSHHEDTPDWDPGQAGDPILAVGPLYIGPYNNLLR